MFKLNCKTYDKYDIPTSCYLDHLDLKIMTPDSIFDLAFLTKIYSTILAMMHLTYTGQLDKNTPSKFL